LDATIPTLTNVTDSSQSKKHGPWIWTRWHGNSLHCRTQGHYNFKNIFYTLMGVQREIFYMHMRTRTHRVHKCIYIP